jgi:hypothetical protein
MLRSALTVVGSSSNRTGRERLKVALAARDAAQLAVVESRETFERLHAIIADSDQAARAAASATRDANEFRKEWVRAGCRHSASRELSALEDDAAEKTRAAERSAVTAAAVSKELARARSVVESAQVDVRGPENAITAAIGVILAQEAAPLLQRFENIAEEYRVTRAKVMGVLRRSSIS